jgi:hypothetical protein
LRKYLKGWDVLIDFEWLHLNPISRQSGDYLTVLHPDFKEFGQSGNIYRIKDLPDEFLDSNEYEIKNFKTEKLSAESRLCTYLLLNLTEKTASNRSSVWVLYEQEWRLLFHQGTKTNFVF